MERAFYRDDIWPFRYLDIHSLFIGPFNPAIQPFNWVIGPFDLVIRLGAI